MNQSEINNQVQKVVSMWAIYGFTSWADFGAFLGAVYTGVLLTEWFWKRLWRPILVSYGFLSKPVKAIPDGDD